MNFVGDCIVWLITSREVRSAAIPCRNASSDTSRRERVDSKDFSLKLGPSALITCVRFGVRQAQKPALRCLVTRQNLTDPALHAGIGVVPTGGVNRSMLAAPGSEAAALSAASPSF